MKRTRAMLTLMLLVVAAMGCNTLGRQPKLQDAAIVPATLKPGDSAVITVKVVDKERIIDRIVGVVLEDTRMKLPVYDNGVAPDVKAGDGIWSLQVDVPPMALAGQFTTQASDARPELRVLSGGGAGSAASRRPAALGVAAARRGFEAGRPSAGAGG